MLHLRRPEDWRTLVETYPHRSGGSRDGWELPGVNQGRELALPALFGMAHQHAVSQRTNFVAPDWSAVAEDYDAVRLTWAGYLTTEGYVQDIDGDQVTMCRYRGSERTLWLSEVFSDPRPGLPVATTWGVVEVVDDDRRTADRHALLGQLGRSRN